MSPTNNMKYRLSPGLLYPAVLLAGPSAARCVVVPVRATMRKGQLVITDIALP